MSAELRVDGERLWQRLQTLGRSAACPEEVSVDWR